MAKRLAYDRVLFVVTLLLMTLGLVMVFSASAMVSEAESRTPFGFLLRQLVGAALGLALMWLFMRVDYRRWKRAEVVYPALFVTIFLLALVFVFSRSHNTHRWIHLGLLSFQPSELAKPTLILFLAYYLESRWGRINEWATLRPVVGYLALLSLLVLLEPDLGTTVALVAIAAAIGYAAGVRWLYFGAGALAAVPVVYWAVFHVAYRRERILAFLHPWANARGASFQIVQSLIAVGSGGVLGRGLMDGRQKLFFLPEPHTDFIFAVTSEELGFIGAAVIVLLFAIFLIRGLRAARRAPDGFGRLLAVGVTAMVVVQALINFSVVTGLVPTKGIPLPFISYGSSSLVVTLASVGLLLSVTQRAN